MMEKRKFKKRVFVSEHDMSTLLQRYTAMTMLTLLQEVAQVKESKIDWNELVKKTTTGITNAREYQMVWRHLAYRQVLLDKVDDDAQPLDDDSDLESDLEAFPPVSNETSLEAAACVKVLVASRAPCDTNMSDGNTIEVPLTISMPNRQTSGTAAENSLHGISAYGTKLTVPVTVQMQPLPSVRAAEGLDTSGPGTASYNSRRRRKPWSAAEDRELIAAVQKCGEGNWASILKEDFKGDRTASQLYQGSLGVTGKVTAMLRDQEVAGSSLGSSLRQKCKRWSIIKKRNMAGNASQLSEAQLAARHAMSVAFGDNLRAACPTSTNVGPNSSGGPSNSSHFAAADIASGGPQSKHRQDLLPSKPIVPKNPLAEPAINPDPMAKAAAMAASSPIAAHSSAAASLQKAAQSKKGVHIMPGGTPAVKSSVPSSFGGLPSNVHFIRTGLVSRPVGLSNASQSGTQQLQALRSASPAVQPRPATVPSRTNTASVVPSAPTSSPATVVLGVKSKAAVMQENQTAVLSNARSEKAGVIRAASLANTPQQQVQKGPTFGSGNRLTVKVEGQELGGESKASRIWIQEKLIPSQESPSNKNENTKTELAAENTSGQGPAPVTCKVVFKDS